MVYENRPDICNIRKVIVKIGGDAESYFAETIRECNRMMDEDNVPQKYRINEYN